MTTPLTITSDRRANGSTPTLIAIGEIDVSNVDKLADGLRGVLADNPGESIVVDLSSVEYIDSGGIRVLFDYSDQISLVVQPLLMRVLSISGITEVTTVESVGRQ